jgi:hypothetical protein
MRPAWHQMTFSSLWRPDPQWDMRRKTSFRIVPLSEVPTDSVLGYPMTCDEKGRLLRQYDNATLAFSNAVQELRRVIGTSLKRSMTGLSESRMKLGSNRSKRG